MEECSLHFISFNLEQIDQLVFWWGRGCFFEHLKLYILDKVKAFILYHKSLFYNAIRPYTQV